VDVERAARPVVAFLTPFFFAISGAQVDPAALAAPGVAGLAAALTAVAVVGKLAGCAAGAWGLGWRRALFVGVGMVPRGEVGLVAVGLGRSLNAVPGEVFAAVVALTLFTTLPVPPILQALHRAGAAPGARRGGADHRSPSAGAACRPGGSPEEDASAQEVGAARAPAPPSRRCGGARTRPLVQERPAREG
jgi:NhaP-type Na+/H+ or K+/H+ antiporter